MPLAVGIPAAAGLALSLTGVIQLPDLNSALARLSRGLGAWIYLLVAGLAFLETAAFVDLIAPGETALALGGVVAAQGHASLVAMIVIAWVGAAAGDLVSFSVGGRVGRSALTTYGARLGLTERRLARVDAFFAAYGPRAILVGRFIGIISAVAPFLAGSTGNAPPRVPAVEPAGNRRLVDGVRPRGLRLQRLGRARDRGPVQGCIGTRGRRCADPHGARAAGLSETPPD
ncbi:MAG: hypothetical protein V7607_4926 [Solirubrobacteraceae bacterium]